MSDTEETGIFKDYASQKRPCVKGFACIENLNLGFVYLSCRTGYFCGWKYHSLIQEIN